MYFNIPGWQITMTEVSKEIAITILQQKKNFTIAQIVDEVTRKVLPPESRDKGHIEIPGEDMFIIAPNATYLEKLVKKAVDRMVVSKDLTVIDSNPTFYSVNH